MANEASATNEAILNNNAQKEVWLWHPRLPIENAPVFDWPPRPLAILKYLFGKGFLLSQNFAFVLLAIITWFYLAPALERCVDFKVDWILQLYALNLALVVLMGSGLQLYFHTFKLQDSERKFDPRELDRNNAKYFANNQVWDNIFWTCASGVTIWTAYQTILMWAYANGALPWLAFTDNPIWFVLLFPVLVFWSSMHFYWVHRLLHWKPLFKLAHSLHHRNVNVGPWSGISMHPIEHVLYFSNFLIHLVIASHPIHLFFHAYHQGLGPMSSHSGFSTLLVKGKPTLDLGDFFHQLHHRYFDCNYGTSAMPWDKWFGSFHDGTPEATARLRRYQINLRRAATHSV